MGTTSKKLAIAILAFSMLSMPLIGYAQTDDGPPCDRRGAGFGGPGQHFAAISEELNLTLEQATLLDAMKTAHRDFAIAENGDAEPGFRGKRRGMHRQGMKLMRPFHDAMRSDNPDFVAAGETIKAGYDGDNKQLLDAMVDAHVAFHASLTDEQLQILRENRPGHRGGHGRGQRNMNR